MSTRCRPRTNILTLAPLGAVALVLLGCCAAPSSGLTVARGEPSQPSGLPGGRLQLRASPAEQVCESLAKVPRLHARPLPCWNQTAGLPDVAPAFACHVESASAGRSPRSAERAGSEAVCSPVCTEALDVVVVLGSSEWSLEESDASRFRRAADDLLKHFALGRARGSLFGFLDVSRGAGKATVLSRLSDDRKALTEALQAWSPLKGGRPVTSLEMQGFEQRPEVLSMLNISRPSVRRTLLVLQLPPKESRAEGPTLLGSAKPQASEKTTDPFARDRQIMELLVSTCPAVRIDPNLECGRMRWGKAEGGHNDELQPWGERHVM